MVHIQSSSRASRKSLVGNDWAVQGWNLGRTKKFFPSPKSQNRLRDPPCLLYNEYRASRPVTKRSERDVDHSLPSSVEAENVWRYTSASPISLNGVDRDFTFTNTKTSQRRLIILTLQLNYNILIKCRYETFLRTIGSKLQCGCPLYIKLIYSKLQWEWCCLPKKLTWSCGML